MKWTCLAGFLLLAMPLPIWAQPDGPPLQKIDGLTVREIRIQGLHATREDVVRGQLTSKVGQPYTEAAAKEDYRNLDRLGVFSSIKINPSAVNNEVVLTVEVQEIARILPYPSFNVTGENGVSAGVGVKLSNLLQRAIALSVSARFGPLTETELLMQSPWRLEKKSWFELQHNYRDRPNESFSFQEAAHEFDFQAGVNLNQKWRVGGRFAFTSMGSDTPGITVSPDNRDNTPALGAVLEYDGRDLRSNPRCGWQFIFDVTQNGGFMGGDGNFVTTRFDVRRYQPVAPRHVLALFSFSTLQSGTVGTDVPIYRTYSIGGTNTVRGWDLNARQGNNQFLTTLEYRYDLLPPKSFRVHGVGFYLGVQLAAFGDLGTTWDNGEDFTRNMIGGGGFGVRLIIPFVEMVRLDFAFGQSGQGIMSAFGIHEKAFYSSQRVR
jgi:outer membrane protein insertion porin family